MGHLETKLKHSNPEWEIIKPGEEKADVYNMYSAPGFSSLGKQQTFALFQNENTVGIISSDNRY